MGREAKLLLGLLATLLGVFVGVLSMKLLVPRPPAGAGPDVDPQEQIVASHDIVEPPALEPRASTSAFTAKRDPFLAPAAFAEPAATEPAEVAEPPDFVAEAPPSETPVPVVAAPRAFPVPAAQPLTARESSVSLARETPIAGAHITAPGDTWWSIAERAYGDGRLYRALYAWNRRLDPRVSTAPGTRLEIPPQPKLAAAWPRLMP